MMKNKFNKIMLAGIGAVFMSATAMSTQASVWIDNFSFGGFDLIANGIVDQSTETFTSPTDLAYLAGDTRHSSLSVYMGRTDYTVNSSMNSVTPGAFVFEAQRFNAARATLSYGTNAPLNIDMTVGGSNTFGVIFKTADRGATVTVNIESNGVEATQTISTPTVGAMYFDYADFVTTTPGTIDYTDIDAIDIIMEGLLAGDYTVQLIQATVNPDGPAAIPSPAAVWGGAMLMAGLLARRRRRH